MGDIFIIPITNLHFMKKLLVAILTIFLFTGCINITEEIFLEKDGSGKYVMSLDMEKMMEMVDMMKALAPDSAKGKDMDMDGSLMDSLQNSMGDLSSVPGITEFRKEKKDKNTYQISFRFKDIKALNDAMRKRNEKAANKDDVYAFSRGNFEFRDTTNFGVNNALNDLAGSDSAQAAMEMVRAMMGDMTYTTIYHFPGKVKNFSNKDAKLDSDGKTLRLQVNMLDREKVSTLRNKVSYKK